MLKLALVFGAVAVLCSPALAQRGRGGGGFGAVSAAQLVRIEKVQKDLGIEKETVTKLEEALTKVRQDNQEDSRKLFNPDTTAEERAAIQKKLSEANDKALSGILNEKQTKRLHQIVQQQQGVRIFSDEKVQKELALTDDQKDKIKEINKDLQSELEKLGFGFKPGGGKPDPAAIQETMKKRQGLQTEAMTNATKILNDKQKSELKTVLGDKL